MLGASQIIPHSTFAGTSKRKPLNKDNLDGGEVKSAMRVLDILEFFKSSHRPGRCKDISESLSIPPSSTNELLKTLVSAGYLLFNNRTKEYFPSPMIYTLGSWWNSLDAGANRLLRTVHDICDRTGESVTLSIQNRWSAQFLVVVQSPRRETLEISEGDKVPLLRCAAGIALLASKGDAEVLKMIRRSCGYSVLPSVENHPAREIIEQIKCGRRKGYITRSESLHTGLHELAVALPNGAYPTPTAICVGGPKGTIEGSETAIVGIMWAMIRQHLGCPTR